MSLDLLDHKAALKTLLGGRTVAFNVVFAQIAGSANAGLFLSQCCYWFTRTTDSDGWFYKTREDWTEEIYLTRSEQETVRRILRDRGFLEEDQRGGLDRKIYYRPHLENIIAAIALLERGEKIPPIGGKPADATADAEADSTNGGKPAIGTAGNLPLHQLETRRCNGANPADVTLYREYNKEVTESTLTEYASDSDDDAFSTPPPPRKSRRQREAEADETQGKAFLAAYRAKFHPGLSPFTESDWSKYQAPLRRAARDGVSVEDYTRACESAAQNWEVRFRNPGSIASNISTLLALLDAPRKTAETAPAAGPGSFTPSYAAQRQDEILLQQINAMQEKMKTNAQPAQQLPA